MTDSTHATESRSRRARIRIEPGEVILEVASIIVAILLALAVNNWQEGVHQRQLLRDNVGNIVHELEYNRASVERLSLQHEREATSIGRFAAPNERVGFDAFYGLFERIAPNGLGLLQVQNVAWQAAQVDRSLTLMPANERLELARIYERQDDLKAAYGRVLEHLESTGEQNLYPLLFDVRIDFGDVRAAETDLLRLYDSIIPELKHRYAVPS